MSASEAEATIGKFSEAGTRATFGNTGTPMQPVTPVDPNDPLTIRRNTNATTP